MVRCDSEHKGTASFAQVLDLAQARQGNDVGGYRAGFSGLVETAQGLARTRPARSCEASPRQRPRRVDVGRERQNAWSLARTIHEEL